LKNRSNPVLEIDNDSRLLECYENNVPRKVNDIININHDINVKDLLFLKT
jgi:hypothetical protein